MFRLIFDSDWFNIGWKGWQNTMLMHDLAPYFKTLNSFFTTHNIYFSHKALKTYFCCFDNISINSCSEAYVSNDYLTYFFTTINFKLFPSFICVSNIYWIEFIFVAIFLFLINLKIYQDQSLVMDSGRTYSAMMYETGITFVLHMIFVKFESFEEALCIIIFWPWCVILVFTHLITLDNNEIFFIFIEWGLPVVYGYLILCEHIWLFGAHIFIFLNGARGRRSLVITLIEDIIAFFILIARVSLQMIRGIICGLYHDFFRELTELIIDTWDSFIVILSWETPCFSLTPFADLMFFWIDVYLVAFVLLFIYFILFLQLMFLLIAIWLFARCWFISKRVVRDNNWHKLFNHV